eukprot:CAMPEP_0114554494 /NCGR_PEP_ID=MMETSP0114-20121206/8240_1 /TAXON_ID=31324 /ORGANISM="Goniomonas sp, Strain m" /LENGTH=515 /DNA_ID=CAMNT_0001739545 /DNA_START=14 /DNA_END=1561 /DNA_ORIENTATION=+
MADPETTAPEEVKEGATETTAEGAAAEKPKMLKAPTKVPQPDEEAVKAQIEAIESQIAGYDARVAQIRGILDKHQSGRGAGSAETDDIRAKLKVVRDKIKAITNDRRTIFDALQERKDARNAAQTKVREMSKSMKFQSLEQIDARIAEIEFEISTSTMDLKQEKALLQEIKVLKASRPNVAELHQLKAGMEASAGSPDDTAKLQEELKEKTASMVELREQEKELVKVMEGLREKRQANQPNIAELSKEQKSLYDLRKEKRAEIRKIQNDLGKASYEWRQYQRELREWKRQQEKIKYEQRVAERKARAEQREEEDDTNGFKEVPTHPWAEEIFTCDDLIKYCESHIPKENTTTAAPSFDPSSTGMVAIGKNSGAEEVIEWCGTKKKGKKAPKKAPVAPDNVLLSHSLDVFNGFSSVGVTAPVVPAHCEETIAALKERKTFFEAATAEDKKKAKEAAAEAAKQSKAEIKKRADEKKKAESSGAEPSLAPVTGEAPSMGGIDFRKAVGVAPHVTGVHV